MPHTYCTNLVHCVFSTKERLDLIVDEVREPLFAYMGESPKTSISKYLLWEARRITSTC